MDQRTLGSETKKLLTSWVVYWAYLTSWTTFLGARKLSEHYPKIMSLQSWPLPWAYSKRNAKSDETLASLIKQSTPQRGKERIKGKDSSPSQKCKNS
jgi:hypothetical protein